MSQEIFLVGFSSLAFIIGLYNIYINNYLHTKIKNLQYKLDKLEGENIKQNIEKNIKNGEDCINQFLSGKIK